MSGTRSMMLQETPPHPGPRYQGHVGRKDQGTHTQVLIEGAGLQHLPVQLGIEHLAEEDVVSDGGKLDPGLLGGQAEALG